MRHEKIISKSCAVGVSLYVVVEVEAALSRSVFIIINQIYRISSIAIRKVRYTKYCNHFQQKLFTTPSNNISIMSVESMQRGHGGRIEDAFAKCKEKGEAAFVTFVTAGFPTKEGKK